MHLLNGLILRLQVAEWVWSVEHSVHSHVAKPSGVWSYFYLGNILTYRLSHRRSLLLNFDRFRQRSFLLLKFNNRFQLRCWLSCRYIYRGNKLLFRSLGLRYWSCRFCRLCICNWLLYWRSSYLSRLLLNDICSWWLSFLWNNCLLDFSSKSCLLRGSNSYSCLCLCCSRCCLFLFRNWCWSCLLWCRSIFWRSSWLWCNWTASFCLSYLVRRNKLLYVVSETAKVLYYNFFVIRNFCMRENTWQTIFKVFSCNPFVTVALWIWQEVDFYCFVKIIWLDLANDSQVPFVEVILGIKNHTFFNHV